MTSVVARCWRRDGVGRLLGTSFARVARRAAERRRRRAQPGRNWGRLTGCPDSRATSASLGNPRARTRPRHAVRDPERRAVASIPCGFESIIRFSKPPPQAAFSVSRFPTPSLRNGPAPRMSSPARALFETAVRSRLASACDLYTRVDAGEDIGPRATGFEPRRRRSSGRAGLLRRLPYVHDDERLDAGARGSCSRRCLRRAPRKAVDRRSLTPRGRVRSPGVFA